MGASLLVSSAAMTASTHLVKCISKFIKEITNRNKKETSVTKGVTGAGVVTLEIKLKLYKIT